MHYCFSITKLKTERNQYKRDLLIKDQFVFKKKLCKTFAIWHYKVFCQIETNLEATVKRINTCLSLLNYFRVFSYFE